MREKVPTWRLNCRCPSARRRWRWAVRLRNGFSVGTGATRAAMPPKTERGVSPVQRCWPRKLPRSVFRLRRASPPCPMKSGRFRAQHTATPAGAAPRAAFGYSRANGDSTRTLRGHFARAARIVRPFIGGASGRWQLLVWTTGAARSVFGGAKHRGGSRLENRGEASAVGSFESSERGRSERHRGSSRQERGRKAGSAAKREPSAALSSRSAALSDRSAAENETEGRTSSLKTGDRGTLGGWEDLALRGNAG